MPLCRSDDSRTRCLVDSFLRPTHKDYKYYLPINALQDLNENGTVPILYLTSLFTQKKNRTTIFNVNNFVTLSPNYSLEEAKLWKIIASICYALELDVHSVP